ncbi:MAG: hypothetical protein IJ705_01770 [Oscillospiraceae bacterium]|nr:hypothetical protein [Oscillospiraceae bacterium]
MELVDLHRLIVVEDLGIGEESRNFRVFLDDNYIGDLEGEGYLTINMVAGRHSLMLRDGRFLVCEKSFVVREDQHITRAFVRTGNSKRTDITFDGGVTEPAAPLPSGARRGNGSGAGERLPSAGGQELRRPDAEEDARPRRALRRQRRPSPVWGYLITGLACFAAGVVVTFFYLQF